LPFFMRVKQSKKFAWGRGRMNVTWGEVWGEEREREISFFSNDQSGNANPEIVLRGETHVGGEKGDKI